MRSLRAVVVSLGVAAVGMLGVGCVHVEAMKTGTKTYEPTKATEVAVFRTPDQVGRKFEEIGVIKGAGDSDFTGENQMIEKMKEAAAQLGANGIILDDIREPTAGEKIAGAVLETGAQRQGKVVAIRYVDEAPAAPAAEGAK